MSNIILRGGLKILTASIHYTTMGQDIEGPLKIVNHSI